MNPNARTDHLSLTLPDWRTALKRRVRRPRPEQQLWLFLAASYAVLATVDLMLGQWLDAGAVLCFLAAVWQPALGRARDMDVRWWGVGLMFFLASLIQGIA